MTLINQELFKRIITSVVLLGCIGGAYLHSSLLFYALLTTLHLLIVIFELPNLFPVTKLQLLTISIVYPGFPILCLGLLNHAFRSTNMLIPLYPFLIAWSADTGGYLLGKVLGKHKMCPLVSPGKTWEGFGGSFIGVLITHTFFMPAFENVSLVFIKNWLTIAASSLFMTTIAFLGGFMLSYFKRKQGLKDAGKVLPGHGGFLDRFDSVFFVAPIIWLILLIQKI